MDNLSIDKNYYNKKAAKGQIPSYGLILYYIGCIDIFIDYQVWSPYLRLWHPVSWLMISFSILVGGITGFREGLKSNKKPKTKEQKYSYMLREERKKKL